MSGPAAGPATDDAHIRHVWVDGRLLPADVPHLNVSDRGFQLGDGIFESMRARRGVVIELDEHLLRLHESAAVMAIPLPADDAIVGGIADLLRADRLDATGDDGPPGDAALRVTVSRGPIDRRGLMPPGWRDAIATVVVQAWPYTPPPPASIERGLRVIASTVRRDPASPLAGVKSTSRADYVYARLEADRAGVDDILFLTPDGAVCEASTANVFAFVRDAFVTPPRTAGILAGTTRTWLLGHAQSDLGVRIVEGKLLPADLAGAEEAFVSSSVAGVVPLVAFEGRPIGTGKPGPRTLALRAAREHWVDERSLEGTRRQAIEAESTR